MAGGQVTMTDVSDPVIERPRRPREIVVFSPHNAWTCASCGDTGDFLTKGRAGTLCMDCADLGHLEFLPAGYAALTRRAKKRRRACPMPKCAPAAGIVTRFAGPIRMCNSAVSSPPRRVAAAG